MSAHVAPGPPFPQALHEYLATSDYAENEDRLPGASALAQRVGERLVHFPTVTGPEPGRKTPLGQVIGVPQPPNGRAPALVHDPASARRSIPLATSTSLAIRIVSARAAAMPSSVMR